VTVGSRLAGCPLRSVEDPPNTLQKNAHHWGCPGDPMGHFLLTRTILMCGERVIESFPIDILGVGL
jgi:hypothetical protein